MAEETNDIIDQIFLEIQGINRKKIWIQARHSRPYAEDYVAGASGQGRFGHGEMQSLDKVSTNAIRVIEYVENNLADFDLDKMADSLYLNKYYLCHMFKK